MSEVYTARNSERFQGAAAKDYGPANRYLGGVTVSQMIESEQRRKAEAIRRGKAIRAAIRMEREIDAAFSGDPQRNGRAHLLNEAVAIREANNFDDLFAHDRNLRGMILGAYYFGAIDLAAMHRLTGLRSDAFDRRLKELKP
jgi:hypothetical protein